MQYSFSNGCGELDEMQVALIYNLSAIKMLYNLKLSISGCLIWWFRREELLKLQYSSIYFPKRREKSQDKEV